MNINELQNYECWINKTPHEIFFATKALGGWKTVFPASKPFPVWASKIRNYFNILPTSLTRLPESNAKHLLERTKFLPFMIRARNTFWANRTYRDYRKKPWGYDPLPFKPHPRAPAKIPRHIMKMSNTEAIAQLKALSGDVYLDNLNRPWFQMAAGSTIYHWGDHPETPTLDAIYQDLIRGQNDTPVFKLISPDDNGGSHEVIIANPKIKGCSRNKRSETIGEVNKPAAVKALTISDPILQGSYNFSETTTQGLAEHEKRDVKPHVHHKMFYVNPPDMFTTLSARKFPALDRERKPLVDQVQRN